MGKLAIKSMLAITAMAWLAQPAAADPDSVEDDSQGIQEYIQTVDLDAIREDSTLAQAMEAAYRQWRKGGQGNA